MEGTLNTVVPLFDSLPPGNATFERYTQDMFGEPLRIYRLNPPVDGRHPTVAISNSDTTTYVRAWRGLFDSNPYIRDPYRGATDDDTVLADLGYTQIDNEEAIQELTELEDELRNLAELGSEP